jgi:ribosomal protein L11 methylase PrmA
MNAVSRKNLTDARAVNPNDVRAALDTGAAFGGVTGIAPSRRMTATCMWGVSDP